MSLGWVERAGLVWRGSSSFEIAIRLGRRVRTHEFERLFTPTTEQPRGEIEHHGDELAAGVKADHEPSELGRVVLQAVALFTAPVDQQRCYKTDVTKPPFSGIRSRARGYRS